MAVPDGAFTGVIGHLEVLGQLEAVCRAGIFAEAAEHAARSVVSEIGENFSARGVVTKPADNDEVFRACESAQIASDAERFAGLGIHVEARRAAVPLGHHGALERVLLGVNIFGRLITKCQPHTLEEVHKENSPEEVSHRNVV
jgi:hypothetical protein